MYEEHEAWIATALDAVIRTVGWPAVAVRRRSDAQAWSQTELLGVYGAVTLNWAAPAADTAPELTTAWLRVYGRGEDRDATPLRHELGMAVADVIERRLRFQGLAYAVGVLTDGAGLTWREPAQGLTWRLGLHDGATLQLDRNGGRRWEAVADFELGAADAGTLSELLDLLRWLDVAPMRLSARDHVARSLLRAVEEIVCGRMDVAATRDDLRRALVTPRLPLGQPRDDKRSVAELLIAWCREHAVPADVRRGRTPTWGCCTVRVHGPATRWSLLTVPVGRATRRRLRRQSRELRRRGAEPLIVTTGQEWEVVSRAVLRPPVPRLPALRWLAG